MRWIGVAAAVAALALAATGCGGSSDSSTEAAGDTAVTETSSTDTSSATEETSTETTSTETTSTETTSAETNGNVSGLTGECKDLAEAGQKFGAAIASSAGANGGNGDLEVTANAFKAFVEQAPDELKGDFAVLAKVIAAYATALKDIDLKPGSTPTPAQIAKLTKLGQSLNSADVQKASTAIAAWSQKHCGATP